MSNMSYCRFENTRNNLRDCQDALEEMLVGGEGKLSRSELVAAQELVRHCCDIVNMVAEAACIDIDTNALDRIIDESLRKANDNATK